MLFVVKQLILEKNRVKRWGMGVGSISIVHFEYPTAVCSFVKI